jgi:hypothetical protein
MCSRKEERHTTTAKMARCGLAAGRPDAKVKEHRGKTSSLYSTAIASCWEVAEHFAQTQKNTAGARARAVKELLRVSRLSDPDAEQPCASEHDNTASGR